MSAGVDYLAMESGDKVRLTLWVKPEIKEELKSQASKAGVSASAYVSVIVSERAERVVI